MTRKDAAPSLRPLPGNIFSHRMGTIERMGTMEKTDKFIEREILTGLIVSDDYIKHLAKIYRPDFLGSSTARLIAGWCFEYYQKYNRAPKKDIEGIFANKTKEMPPQQEEDIEKILSGLSEEYEKEESLPDNDFLFESTIKYFQERQAKNLLNQLKECQGDIKAFTNSVEDFKPIELSDLFPEDSINAADLYKMEEKQMNWLVKNLIPIGLTIMGGTSKVGKSYFMLNLAMGLSQGKPLFGEEGFRGRRGRILYLSLEDIQNRFARRMREIDPNPDLESLKKNLTPKFRWNKLTQGGLEDIRKWIEKSKATTRLVVIDTLAKVWNKKSTTGGGGLYAEEYQIYSPLADLAHKYEISIILITHTTKGKTPPDVFDKILGGMGTQGPADNLILLRNDTGGKKRFSIRGKDIEEKHYIFSTAESPGRWIFEGEAGEVQKTAERQALYKLIEEKGSMGFQEIKQKVKEYGIGVSPNSVNTVLRKMVADGTLEQNKRWGDYSIAGYHTRQGNATVASHLRRTK